LRLSVLHLVGSFHTGGSERQAVQLVRLLKANGRHDVHLACLDGGGVLREEVERLGLAEIPEYRLTSFYDANMIRQLRRFAAMLRERRIDVVQTHDFYSNIFGMIGAALARVPVRIAARRETIGWRSNAQKHVERMAYRLAHAIVANAEAVKTQLISEGVAANKIEVVYNGLDLERIRPASAVREEILASFGLPVEGDLRFVTIVANLRHAVKDHPTFLRAASRVMQCCPQARFVLAGEGELTAAIEQLAVELGIGEQTFFIGRTERVADLLAASDVCVLSSQAEGFSNSILEAMAAGLPVVATAVGDVPGIVAEDNKPLIVAPEDEAGFAAALDCLADQASLRRAVGEANRELARDRYDEAEMIAAYARLYGEAMGRPEALTISV